MPLFHKIWAQLHENTLSENPKGYIARVIPEKALTVKELAQDAAERKGVALSAETLEYATELVLKEMVYKLCDGFSINTGYFTAQPTIRGLFDSPVDRFDRTKHSVSFDFKQGFLARNELDNVDIEIHGLARASCFIAQVIDVKTGSINGLLSPNGAFKIQGRRLKITGDNEGNGVYFVNQETDERIPVDSSDIVHNIPSELTIVTPALIAGTYKVEVVTQYTIGGKPSKKAKTAVFETPLTVQ
ncbi:MAG: DUF4469 domain-containing protein [Spirochaetaceae bacterium]|jgi:hypothetical protein|nr:DUF4469 domain-containing protein [Spirochaetaceae bacterium]